MKKTVLLLCCCAVLAGCSRAPDRPTEADLAVLRRSSKAFSSVAKKAIPAVVFIRVERRVLSRSAQLGGGDAWDELLEQMFGQQRYSAPRERSERGEGSGFIISKDGYILTNNHVVGDMDNITVKLHDGRELPAKLIGSDPRSEVAVIKIDGKDFPYVELGDSSGLEIGEWVVAVGNPFGLSESLTVGVVSATGRSLEGAVAEYEDFIQTDAAINPGNSGGPLLNIDGKVVGINTAIFSRTGGYIGIGFAIPINMVRAIKDQLIKTGRMVPGFVGIVFRPVDSEVAEQLDLKTPQGLLIEEVLHGSAAEDAGLKHGDVILAVNGKLIASSSEFRALIGSHPPGTKFSLTIFRDGKKKKIELKTGEPPDETASIGEVEKLFEIMGMRLEDLTDDEADLLGCNTDDGVLVTEVALGGQAAREYIRPGYLITSVGRQRVSSVKEFVALVKKTNRRGIVMLRVRNKYGYRYVTMLTR